MLSDAQITLVQKTFAMVEPIADVAAQLFYGRLFDIDSSLREMFPEDMTEQRKKLMKTLKISVAGLRATDKILPALQSLGRRHIGYEVEDVHYEIVGQALIWTLEQGLDEAFTDEVREAWVATYTLLATVMQEAAEESGGQMLPEDEAEVPPWETPEFLAWLEAAATPSTGKTQ